MPQDTNLPGSECFDPNRCPVETTLSIIGGRWKPLILYHLRRRPTRFNEMRRLVPKVTQRMLTQHLRELEADGVVSRTVEAVVPPRVTYALTDYGWTLLPVLDAMAAWGSTVDARPARHAAAGLEAAAA